MTGNGDRKLLTPDEVADQLGIPKATLYKWRTGGKGPPGFRIGVHLRYRQSDIDKWLNEQKDDWG